MSGAGQGFEGDFLIGDPPSSSAPASQPHSGHDVLMGLNAALDRFDFGAVQGIDARVIGGAVSSASFAHDLATSIGAGQLHAHDAVLFRPLSGDLHGHVFLVVDTNGVAGYQAGHDEVFDLSHGHLVSVGQGDFV
jgi:hypothetical protein